MPDLTYQHGPRVNRMREGTVSFEIPDQALADNLNGPVTASCVCYMPTPASCGSKRVQASRRRRPTRLARQAP